MATAIQVAGSHCGELFSFAAHFLHVVGTQFAHVVSAFLALFSTKRGERCFTYAVHRVVHSCVHQSDSSKSRKEKKLSARRCAFWAAAWAGGGLERPTFLFARAPKKVCRVVPAHTLSPKVRIMHTFAIPIP